MHDFLTANPHSLNANNMDHEARIHAAITDLESQDRVNYSVTAKKWNIDRSTLSRRHRGKTASIQDANSYAQRQLTDTQEKTLIQYINKLSNRGLLLTPQIVKNLAEEITGVTQRKNWVARFYECCEKAAFRPLFARLCDSTGLYRLNWS